MHAMSIVSCSQSTASDGGSKSPQKMDLKERRSKRLCPNLLNGPSVGLEGQEHREQSQSARLQAPSSRLAFKTRASRT